MGKINNVVAHISDSPFGCMSLYRRWHTLPPPYGKGWNDVAYNFGIGNGYAVDSKFYNPLFDGALEQGRMIDGDMHLITGEAGAHALGYNRNSIGIVLTGKRKPDEEFAVFTPKQMHTFIGWCIFVHKHYGVPYDRFFGHYETEQANGKTCPDMDMPSFREILKFEHERHESGEYKYF